MGHFEKGKWIEDRFEKLQEGFDEIQENIEDDVNNVVNSIVEWEKHSGNFENGKEISFTDSLIKIFGIFADKFKFLKL